MQIHPMIARLRREPAPQPCTDGALAAWRAGPQMTAITAALTRYGAGEPLAALPDLVRVVEDHAAASALTQGLIAPLLEALRREPMAQVGLTHSAAPGFVRLRLAASGSGFGAGAALTLAAYARRAEALPASALFEDCEAHEIVVAGEARALLHRLTGSRLQSKALACAPGTRLIRHGPDTARQFTAIMRPLLVLQLTREAASPAPSREIALVDGAQVKTISGCKRASQQMMALAVLGALRHGGAAAEMAQLAQDRSAERDLRWEGLRQLLALDAPQGLAVLAALADASGDPPDDPLTPPAAALQRQLLASRPELAAFIPQARAMEPASCPW